MSDDPWVMYYVVRSGVPFSLEQAMASAGAAAVDCVERFGPFEEWHERPRKVALRADEEEFGQIQRDEPCSVEREVLLCLPPRRRSERSELLAALRPFTDAPRPREVAEEDDASPTMAYVIRPGVMRTAGKAMAQAGHAALMCVEELGERNRERFDAWREAGRPGELLTEWERYRDDPEAVTVSDAGHTQVAPGTETVIALVPSPRGSRRA
ncbi:MAG TPA: peptidyl-tRNA hydrolase [Thermoleophilaceae bacterium]|jgi:peptidyl-tRNA hydrolase